MSALSVILVPMVYMLLTMLLVGTRRAQGWLDAIAKTHVLIFTLIAISTELLSAAHWIDPLHMLIMWSSLTLICIIIVARMRHRFAVPSPAPHGPILLLAFILFILASTFAAAILYPPNNYDSMTFHMARVANWISHRSVSFYPTAIARQNYEMPLSEFAILHLQVLAGSDVCANLVQWACLVASISLGALVAEELGLAKRQQVLSAFIIATIPMAILQGSTTQTDLVVTSFIFSFALHLLRLRTAFTPANAAYAALSLGLALLAKGTAWLYCPALGIALALPILFAIRSDPKLLTRQMGRFALIVFIAVALSGGHFLRNSQLYGAPISDGGENYWNPDWSPASLAGNIARNIAVHLGTASPRFNDCMYHALQRVLGEQLNNPRTTWRQTFFYIPYRRHEDYAGNPFHMLAVLFTLGSAILWTRKQPRHVIAYAVGVFVAALIYCVGLKWQPWASRLQTPLFALAAPVVVIALTHEAGRLRRGLALLLFVSMALFSFAFALNNETRSLLSMDWKKKDRMELYFAFRPTLYESYGRAVDLVLRSGAPEVGLHLGEDSWEYPFWAFEKQYTPELNLHFRQVGVNNASKTVQSETVLPDYVIATVNTDAWYQANMDNFRLVYGDKNVSVLTRARPDRTAP